MKLFVHWLSLKELVSEAKFLKRFKYGLNKLVFIVFVDLIQ